MNFNNIDYKKYIYDNCERIVTVAALIFLFVVVCFVAPAGIDKTDAPGFAKEAQTVLTHTKVYGYNGGEYAYETGVNDNVGVATSFQESDYDFIDTYRQRYVDAVLETVEPNEDVFQGVFFNSCICESDRNTLSLLISYSKAEYHHNKRKIVEEGVKTYLFNKANGLPIAPEQILAEDYRTAASAIITPQFAKTNKLAENGQAGLTDDRSNYNNFMLNDNNIVFFFNPDEVYKAEEGIQKIAITREEASSWVRDEILERYIDPNKPMVALTYDDGPGGKAEAKIHKLLKKYGAVATFFYSGYMIKGHEDQIKESVDMGFEIGNHTWNHPVLTRCDKKELKKQFKKTNKAIKKACGQDPTVFRPSYGATNEKVNKKSKLPVIIWDIDTRDWESRDAKKIYKVVKKQKNLDGKIILMHSIYPTTAKATEKILPYLEKKGIQTVTVSELIRYRYGEEPVPGKVYSGWY